MHPRLYYLSLITATLLLSQTFPLQLAGTTLGNSNTLAQTQTEQNLNREGIQQLSRGQFREALETFQKVLVICRKRGDKTGVGLALNNIAAVYDALGQYSQALEFYQQALVIHKEVANRPEEGVTLNNIGLVHYNLGQYPQALEFYQQALAILKGLGNYAEGATLLNNIGEVYRNLGQYSQALEFYQQALAIHRTINNRAGAGVTLNNIAAAYYNLKQYSEALLFYQQALSIQREIGDRVGERSTLSNIGFLLAKQNQPELAIVFYKQSLNVTEALRQDIRVLPKEQQESYTETVADTYRYLADLLLQQDRVLEAQQVLDLLKVQELDDYLRDVRGNEQTAQGVEMLPQERSILELYNQAIASSHELKQLRSIPYTELTAKQQQRLAELVAIEQEITVAWNEFIQIPEVATALQELSRITDEQNFKVQQFRNLQDNLQNLQQNAVLLYPLILENRLELVLVTPHSPPIRRTVAVGRTELNKGIVAFRQALENPKSDAVTPAQQLYELLIQPLENDLKAANAETIIYAPDGALRYIPLAALHDGKKWLAQRFRINHITAASIDDLNLQPQPKLTALAAAFTKGNFSVPVGDRELSFSGLPYAGTEVENLAATIPNTTKLLDGNFSRDATIPQMDSYTVVHLATHAAFVTGQPNESFILFGNGDRVTLNDVKAWTFSNVDLFVLSACETGVGGQLGDGREILGFGYLMEQAGARAAIASLWQVSDGGTQVLMNAFYAALNKGMTKSEALRQAQIALITGNYKALGEQRGLGVEERIQTNLPTSVTSRLSHPYYWAPFILIGNGL